ncbi:hypothetical protein BDW68DRAFT_192855 [Aspergillus falconensis]
MIHRLPSPAKPKLALWAFSLVPLVPFLGNLLDIRAAQSSLIHSHNHPIEALFIEKQSETYAAAYDEYVRRYGVQSTRGYEAWFEYAKSYQSPIIDGFDTLYSAISPFGGQTGADVLKAMDTANDAPNSKLWLCAYLGKLAQTSCSHPYRSRDRSIQLLFNTLPGELRGALPDIKFLVNHLDEPSVVIPPGPDPSGMDSQGSRSGQLKFNLTDLSETIGQNPYPTLLDLCQHPEYSAMHGMLISPTTFRPIESLVPVLSTGSPSTTGYIESELHSYICWAGSTTGGFATNDNQRSHFHWQRFHCKPQRSCFRLNPWADKDRALHSRLIFDIDDNGISGRCYKLLASSSAPLKQTLIREWHDDRLIPWLHYIPVSQCLDELPEMVSFAEQGEAWFGRALRDIGRPVYIYRLLSELARLQDPERPALLQTPHGRHNPLLQKP